MSGAAIITARTAGFAEGNNSLGIVAVMAGIALLVSGVAHSSNHDKPAGTALIVAGATVAATAIIAVIIRATVHPTDYRAIGIIAIFWFGSGIIQSGLIFLFGGRRGYIIRYPEHLQQ